jgi:hypothetical protein
MHGGARSISLSNHRSRMYRSQEQLSWRKEQDVRQNSWSSRLGVQRVPRRISKQWLDVARKMPSRGWRFECSTERALLPVLASPLRKHISALVYWISDAKEEEDDPCGIPPSLFSDDLREDAASEETRLCDSTARSKRGRRWRCRTGRGSSDAASCTPRLHRRVQWRSRRSQPRSVDRSFNTRWIWISCGPTATEPCSNSRRNSSSRSQRSCS